MYIMRCILTILFFFLPIVTGFSRTFVHPGMLHSREDLVFVKEKVLQGEEPWKRAWMELRRSEYSSLDYKPQPFAFVARGEFARPHIGSYEFSTDGAVAYTMALQWAILGEKAYAEKAIEILNSWSYTLKSVSMNDQKLLIGMAGIHYLNAAEIIRHTYDGWKNKDQRQFEKMVMEIWYEALKDYQPTYNGNWDAAICQTMLCIGVFMDRDDIFDKTYDHILKGETNGAIDNYFMETGQCQESGRDQTHTQMGLGYLCAACEIAWKQGLDLYSAYDNRLAKAYEYTAKYMSGEDVPYVQYTNYRGQKVFGTAIGSGGRGRFSNIYERAYNHYHNRKGLELPYTKAVLERNRIEGFSLDHVCWATLMNSKHEIHEASGESPLHLALRKGDINEAKRLISAGENVNSVDGEGIAPLNMATLLSNKDLVERLVKAGADVNHQDKAKVSALMIAAEAGNTEIVKYLLDNGADPNLLDMPGFTPLYWAAREGRIETVKALIKAGADPQKGASPLRIATWRGNTEMVKLLIDSGADVNYQLPLNTAIYEGHEAVAEILRQAGARMTPYSPALRSDEVAKVVNDAIAWQKDNMPEKGRAVYNPRYTGWADGTFLTAVAEWTSLDDSRGFRDWLKGVAEEVAYQPGRRSLNPANDVGVCMAYANLYLENPQSEYLIDTITDFGKQLEILRGGWKMISPTIERLDYMIKYYPQMDDDLDFYLSRNQVRWCWCDALYMVAPTLAAFANITGKSEYREFMNTEFWRTIRNLYDPEEKLIYRDTRYKTIKSDNGAKMFWGRGNGWTVGAIVRTLTYLPKDYPDRNKYEKLLKDMMSRLVTLQDADGYWNTSLLDREFYPNAETSATGFITYALWWGINNGVLDEKEYLPYAKKGWQALVKAVHPNGMLGSVQAIGDAPAKISPQSNEVYGTAALVLTGKELLLYLNSQNNHKN